MTRASNSDQLDPILSTQLTQTIERTDLPGLGERYQGKVRDTYARGAERIIVVTDRISAFDRVIGTIPFKGQVLNQMAQYWFEATAEVAKNHVLSVPDANAMVVHDCTPLKAEFVMRSYLTGSTSTSIWRAYERGERVFCGHKLPDGMVRHQPLERPILTPSTKAEDGEHDVSVSREQLLEMGAVSEEHFDRAADMAHRLFAFGQKLAAERGMILVDTKYE
ncbi:MAG: phosphoribosylaminoimidazolesuccinocarboxamide synthase, partial [Myxococcota bacterium]